MALPFSPPASLDPSFTISRPSEADIDKLAHVYYESFWTGQASIFWWSPDRDTMIDWLHVRVTNKMANPGVRHFQIVDNNNGEVVGFTRWDIPKGYEDKFGAWTGPVDVKGTVKPDVEAAPTPKAAVIPPRGGDPELCRAFFGAIAEASKRWDTSGMLGLSLLCTSPKYFRRGAARALLEPMLAIADREGLRTYLEATPAGYPVYEKLGFRTVEVIEFDLAAMTGGKQKRVDSLTIMIREPQLT
ncbi:hypothetical protein GGS20DRAFT_413331 [Poronia punctata]|nr:hypothetical protein GGS20DRAFT_413331 [Poronia punctata]